MTFRIRPRRDTAANWTAANPILLEGEMALEGPIGGPFLVKIGDGTTAWNSLPYNALSSVSTAGVIELSNQSDPTPPVSGANIYTRPLGGRSLLRVQDPSGLQVPLQPSIFQNAIFQIFPNASTSVVSQGNTATSVGAISHSAITAAYGYMSNFASASTAGATAGTGSNTLLFQRSLSTDTTGGFYCVQRLAFPDSSYDRTGGSTGSRIFIGLTSGTLAASAGADIPAATSVGFIRRHVAGGPQDTEWQFFTRGGTSFTVAPTGVNFVARDIYDFFIFSPPGGTSVSWEVRNLRTGDRNSGSTTATLPGINVPLRAGFQIATINAVARNIRMRNVYVETNVA